MSDQEPRQPLPPPLPAFYQAKAAAVYDLMHGNAAQALLTAGEFVAGPYAIVSNAAEAVRLESPVRQEVRDYLSGPRPDIFELYGHASALVSNVQRGVPFPDMADLVMTAHAARRVIATTQADVPSPYSPEIEDRTRKLVSASVLATARTASYRDIDRQALVNLGPMYRQMVGDYAEGGEVMVEMLHDTIRDRLLLEGVIRRGDLSREAYASGRANFYNRPLNPAARHEMEVHSAEVIERLHLLKAYPVTAFEVSSEQLGLPWDVAVVPPLENVEGEYAEGAIADFILLLPGESREGVAFERADHDDRQLLTVGGAAGSMRFRLHDDGRITHGMQYHNVPNDDTEYYFEEAGAQDAFIRLRSLFIALAFDAVVPEDIASDQAIRGSVATALRAGNRGEPPQNRITQLLLRRRRFLERSGITPDHPEPDGWERPEASVQGRHRVVNGHFFRLREGYQARPTAETESRRWYSDHNLVYPGWREGYSWRGDSRRGVGDTIYRRAYFRSTSETARRLGDLGLRKRRS